MWYNISAMAEKNRPQKELTTSRILALTDGIFAIAMTILVLNLQLPESASACPASDLLTIILGQGQRFFNYFLSFVLLAIFWIIHHQMFHHIKRTNRVHLWINICILMFIALVPFSASMFGLYHNEAVDEAFFGANIFILGILYYYNWKYATDGCRLVDKDLSRKYITDMKNRSLVIPAVSLLAILLAFFSSIYAPLIYIIAPLVMLLPGFKIDR